MREIRRGVCLSAVIGLPLTYSIVLSLYPSQRAYAEGRACWLFENTKRVAATPPNQLIVFVRHRILTPPFARRTAVSVDEVCQYVCSVGFLIPLSCLRLCLSACSSCSHTRPDEC